MKYLGTILVMTGIAAFLATRLNVNFPEGVTIPTLPTDILGGLLIVAGIAKNIYDDVNK
jgi:hypothetical protein